MDETMSANCIFPKFLFLKFSSLLKVESIIQMKMYIPCLELRSPIANILFYLLKIAVNIFAKPFENYRYLEIRPPKYFSMYLLRSRYYPT